MPAITAIPSQYPTQYDANWMSLAQQKPSKLMSTVTLKRVMGKELRLQQLGQRAFQAITGRAQDTRISDQSIANRWLSPYPYDDAVLFDEWDEMFLGEISLPKSDVITESVYAYNRAIDGTIVAAAVGNARTGSDGLTQTPLPAGQIIAVDFVEQGTAANSGLTVAKFRQAKYLLDVADVDDEDRVAVVAAKQIQDMLRTTEATSADYNTIRALVNGELNTFMGFQIKRVSASILPYTLSTDIRAAVFYAKSGIALTDTGVSTKMSIRDDKSEALQVRSKGAWGATRTEEVKVVEAFCDESP